MANVDLSILSDPSLLSEIRVPQGKDSVYKDECMFSHDSPFSPKGLFVSLSSFLAFGADYVMLDHQRSKRKFSLYLNLRKVRKPAAEKEKKEEPRPNQKPTQLAIGVEGGFDVGEKKIEYDEFHSLYLLPNDVTIPLPNNELPIMINLAIDQILVADSASRKQDVSIWTAEKRVISKFAENLVQLENGVKIPPKGWKCSKCDLTENLWMNLTDGTILCGRKNWDGSGGNGHALQHFKETNYPLCVKLGTISGDGASDVFSYAEDDMVEDPKIKEHLMHFGINMEAMQKTEKSIAEMEIDQNMSYEFNRLQESGKELVPLHGPGLTGLYNIGSSCYLASVMQVLFSIPHFIDRFVTPAEEIFQNAPSDPAADFHVQMAKLGKGLLSGNYSAPDHKSDHDGISPRSFKHVVGKGHPEFSTMKQQDAMEFFQHLLEMVERKERAVDPSSPSPSIAFKFRVEDRVECQISHLVKYTSRNDNILSIPVPLDKATNKEELAAAKLNEGKDGKEVKTVRPKISLLDCLKAFAEPELIPDFYSTATKSKGLASKTTRLGTMPPFLMMQVRKFTLGDDWVPRKLDIHLDVPDLLDLEWLRGPGLQPGEQELPEESDSSATTSAPKQEEIQIDEGQVLQLIDMGFDPEGCRKAVFYTKNSGVENAMNWVLEHMGDPDFSMPLVFEKKEAAGEESNPESVEMLEAMGFSKKQAVKALKATSQNLERAAEWLFSHAEDMDTEEPAPQGDASKSKEKLDDGKGNYRLKAIISHMGANTSCGHYVCHIRKDDRWVLFNDEKVALSEDLPKDLGYLYLYERI